MRDEMQPGTGVRTIGGMYATVKEIHDDTVLLEVAPGVHAIYAKNAIGAVLADEEYNRILDGADPIHGRRAGRPGRRLLADRRLRRRGRRQGRQDRPGQDRGRGRRAAVDEPAADQAKDAKAAEDTKDARTPSRRTRTPSRTRRSPATTTPSSPPHGTAEHAWCVVHRGSVTV